MSTKEYENSFGKFKKDKSNFNNNKKAKKKKKLFQNFYPNIVNIINTFILKNKILLNKSKEISHDHDTYLIKPLKLYLR